jgi:hypothetical protein
MTDKGLKNIRKLKSGNRGNKEKREAETMEERNCGSEDLETRTSDRKSISEGQDSANRVKERQDISRRDKQGRNGQKVRERIVAAETRSEGQDGGS